MPQTAALSDPRELQPAIYRAPPARAAASVTPASVERECRGSSRAREVRDEPRPPARSRRARRLPRPATSATPRRFGALIDEVYARHGRIDGVIHGAGVIEDKLVRDKEPASFERVVATKAGAARTLVGRAAARDAALPRVLQLRLRPLREPRPGRLRRRQRGAQQARPGARPALGRAASSRSTGGRGRRRAWSRRRSSDSSPSAASS